MFEHGTRHERSGDAPDVQYVRARTVALTRNTTMAVKFTVNARAPTAQPPRYTAPPRSSVCTTCEQVTAVSQGVVYAWC